MRSLRKLLCAAVLCTISGSAGTEDLTGPQVTILLPRSGMTLHRYDVVVAFRVEPTRLDARTLVLVRTNQGTPIRLLEVTHDPDDPSSLLVRTAPGEAPNRVLAGDIYSESLFGLFAGPFELSLLAYEADGGRYRETLTRVAVMIHDAAVTEWAWLTDDASGVRYPNFVPTSLLARKRMPGVCNDAASVVGLASVGGDSLDMNALEPLGSEWQLPEIAQAPAKVNALSDTVALAGTLADQGKYIEADAMYSEIVKRANELYGEAHPVTRHMRAVQSQSHISRCAQAFRNAFSPSSSVAVPYMSC
jgi:hypothetical protein